jgi:hypothetical protein
MFAELMSRTIVTNQLIITPIKNSSKTSTSNKIALMIAALAGTATNSRHSQFLGIYLNNTVNHQTGLEKNQKEKETTVW